MPDGPGDRRGDGESGQSGTRGRADGGGSRASAELRRFLRFQVRAFLGDLSCPVLDDLRQEAGGAFPPAPRLLLHPSYCVRREIEPPPGEDSGLSGRAPFVPRLDRTTPELPVRPAHLQRDRWPRASVHLAPRQRQPVVLAAQPAPDCLLPALSPCAGLAARPHLLAHHDLPSPTEYRRRESRNRSALSSPFRCICSAASVVHAINSAPPSAGRRLRRRCICLSEQSTAPMQMLP